MFKFAGAKPENLGPENGKLARCSWKPNCVCSQYEDDEAHFIAPIKSDEPLQSLWKKLLQILADDPAAEIKEANGYYLHVEFSSRLMGFVDDVEFLGIPGDQTIHVRSASRLGVRDFGVNRNRIETIRSKLSDERARSNAY